MHSKWAYLAFVGLLAAVTGGWIVAKDGPLQRSQPEERSAPSVAAEKGREADTAAIHKNAEAFVEAFNKGNAKAVAALWTAHGGLFEDSGIELRGRDAIEKVYAELFKEQPHAKIEIEVLSVHFPSRDSAMEEGIV